MDINKVYDEVHTQLSKDCCQSVPNIAFSVAEECLRIQKEDFIEKLNEILEMSKNNISLSFEMLSNYINELEQQY